MKERLPQTIIMASGAILIILGLALVFIQLSHEMSGPAFTPQSRSLETSPSGAIKLSTTYVGLVVIGIGAMLEVVGYVASTPWRK